MCSECESQHDNTGGSASVSSGDSVECWSETQDRSIAKSLLERSLIGSAGYNKKTYGALDLTLNMDGAQDLEAHYGCVNALSWSEDGRFLASGSDDTHIMLWDAQESAKGLIPSRSIHTGHRANIFDVQWLPNTSNSKIVSVAGDAEVRVFDIEHIAQRGTTSPPSVYTNNMDRVKRIVTENSHTFLTCSEDGSVRQYDLRQGIAETMRRRPLVHYKSPRNNLTALTINRTMPYLFATGGSAPFAFLHDRRMLRHVELQWGDINGLDESKTSQLVRLFSSHVSKRDAELTALKFSTARPSELLCSWLNEGIFVYDINGEAVPTRFDSSAPSDGPSCGSDKKISGENDVPEAAAEPGIQENPWHMEDEDSDAEHDHDHEEDFDDSDYDDEESCDSDDSRFDPRYYDEYDSDSYMLDQDLLRPFMQVLRTSSMRPAPNTTCKSVNGVPKLEPTSRAFKDHINIMTTKDVCYYGMDDEYVMSGSDDGALFIWDRGSGKVMNILKCDTDTVNAMAPHPFWPQIAVSGIDDTIKILEPFCPILKDSDFKSRALSGKFSPASEAFFAARLCGKRGSSEKNGESRIMTAHELHHLRCSKGLGPGICTCVSLF
ncbi:WD40-repeat-containing domain protein [Protomyces lactucae-debilis]|uniref:WD40-repeat-containing domain protein n=1 Tax=Protomyces lactucae-debilis TaxID=2754530 RepID=A0A1Y2F6E3_PROLT|nr:WD40-repeat-containing domain protein [Protomyces lactucae-debilis]ORY79409.1 WD40-repeat-containing domain protein [Protomyces lactucae-debilis]